MKKEDQLNIKGMERAKVISILVNIILWKYKPLREEIKLIQKYLTAYKIN